MAMAKSAEVDDPSQHAAAGTATPVRQKNGAVDAFGVPPLMKYRRRPELTEELRQWYALDGTARLNELKRTATGEKRWSIEVLVHAVRQAHAAGDRRTYVQAFNAFATRATPLLMRQAAKYDAGEDEDHAQEVFLITAKEVQAGKAEYAEANFADYAMRKAIDAHRRKEATIESKRERLEPSTPNDEGEGDVLDPVDEIEDRMASPEVQGLLRRAVGRLEGKLRDVLIQYHIERLTYEELAEHYGVDESTIRNWVKRAEKLAGRQGGNDDHED
jgi:RNA polymerase sigma factor (sigma-70 family)